MRIFIWFNYAEAVLWMGMAVFFGFRIFKRKADQRGLFLVFAMAFFAFGIRDLVEVQTGAWWRPWWLLLWKGTCVAVLAIAFYRLFKRD